MEDMKELLPRHLTQDDVLGAEEAAEVLKATGDALDEMVSPFNVRCARATGNDFVEWRGEGKFIYTPEGESYFDCVGAGGVFGLGFAHPALVEAVTLQVKRGGLATRVGFLPGQAELSKKLLKFAPDNLKYVYYGNSGTEAVEAALKLARLTTGKKKLIGTQLGYHGMSIATVGLSGIGMWRDGTGPFVEGTVLVEHGDLEAMDSAIDDDTAAVVLELVQWASGCKVVDLDYFKSVAELCRRRGALLILDEVQTGLGRTGYPFALEHWGVEPDLLCVGKILSGGMVPISAVLYTEEVHRAERMRSLYNNSSYGGNPLACAAGVTTMNLLESTYFERAKTLGELLGEGFTALCGEFPSLLSGFHGLGLMRCLEFSHPVFGVTFGEKMRQLQSTIVASMGHIPQFVRVSPPFICDDEDIEELIESCRLVLRVMKQSTPQEMYDDITALVQKVQKAVALPVDEELYVS